MKNTHMSQWIPPSAIQKSAGTWTPTLSTNLVLDLRTANDSAFNLFVHIPLPSNSQYRTGAYLKSIDVYYKVATAAMDAIGTVALKKMTLPATGTIVSGADVSVTIDTGHDTDAERLAVGDHTMTVTLDTPAWIDDGEEYVLYIACDAAATSVFTLYGARANFDLKLE
jgi:hypothetical protein